MTSPSGRSTIVFNGEIYNAPRAARASSSAKGAAFATDHSDTEVVLALWEERGAEGLRRAERHVRVRAPRPRAARARARCATASGSSRSTTATAPFAFASELRTLLHVPGIERELDRESLFHYLSLRFVPGERSILAGREAASAGAPASRTTSRAGVPTVRALVEARVRQRRRSGRAARAPARRRRALDARRRSRRGLALGRSRLVGGDRAARGERRRRAHVLARLRGRGRRAAARAGARRALGHRSPRGGRRRGRAARRSARRWSGRSTSPTAAGFPPGTSTASWPRT